MVSFDDMRNVFPVAVSTYLLKHGREKEGEREENDA
jgi:hypothetical protein